MGKYNNVPQSTGRSTDIANMLERFLDDNVSYIPPRVFDDLDDLAGDIEKLEDEIADNHRNKIDDLQSRIDELEQQILEMEEEGQ